MKRVKKLLFSIKQFVGFFYRSAQEMLKTGWKRRNARYFGYYKRKKLKQNCIVYESFFGRGMLCGPYALFDYMLNAPEYSQFEHIWVLDKLVDHKNLIQRYKNYKNVHFVEYLQRDYLKVLATAKYLINNTTFPSFFTKKEGQIYINTWHGIPLKKLGFDMPDGADATSNIIRNFIQVDYLVSANHFLTDIYKHAYKLDGIFEGTIIEEGYPRLDLLVKKPKDELIRQIRSAGVEVDATKKIILYAPTWKENCKDANLILTEYASIKRAFESARSDYQVLIKAHQFVYNLIKDKPNAKYIIPATIDANEVLPIADILISDYSSIYFDYLYFKRPILFYIPDMDQYKEYRGIYMSLDDLPGPYSEHLEDVVGWLRNIDTIALKYSAKLNEVRDWSYVENTGNISPKILDIAMGGKKEQYHCINGLSSGKKKILLHRGQMRVNGISTSFLNLLNHIDLNKYDVSVVVTESKDALEKELLASIPDGVRVLMRKSTFNFTYFSMVQNRMMNAYGVSGWMRHFYPKEAYEAEVKRCFGDCKFDYAVDFEGYSLSYALIIASIRNAKTAIWQHNDLEAECRVRFPYLKTIFSLFPQFDRLISCSKAIMEVNRKKLATKDTYGKFVYCKNMIDISRIENLLRQNTTVTSGETEYCITANVSGNGAVNAKLIALTLPEKSPTIVTVDGIEYCVSNIPEEAVSVEDTNLIPLSQMKKELIRFVTVGRISPEKNHINLVRAFAKFVNEGNLAILYIVGDGPQKETLKKEIDRLKMGKNIIMTGNVTNPIAIMSHCHCFILPSLHEGQPMVVNEARMLNMPIILSQFSSVQGAMVPNGQYIISSDEKGIFEGLRAYVNGKVPQNYQFDAVAYNQEAYEEFLCAIGEHEYAALG